MAQHGQLPVEAIAGRTGLVVEVQSAPVPLLQPGGEAAHALRVDADLAEVEDLTALRIGPPLRATLVDPRSVGRATPTQTDMRSGGNPKPCMVCSILAQKLCEGYLDGRALHATHTIEHAAPPPTPIGERA